MYIDESTEKENLLLGRNPSKIKDKDLKEKYWNLREETDGDDE